MKWRLFQLLIILLCLSCKPNPVDLGLATAYFPSSKELRKGFVYKFYVHRHPDNKNDEITTDIQYRMYKFIDPDILELKTFDAGYDLIWYYKNQVADDQFRIMDSYQVLAGDTIFPKTRKNVAIDWQGNEALTDVDLEIGGFGKSTSQTMQTEIKDTIINEAECKLISKSTNYQYISKRRRDTTNTVTTSKMIFTKNKGLTGVILDNKRDTTYHELIERMSVSEFERRANHGKVAIGYIDPKNTLDDHSEFKLCNAESRIAQYYGCKKRGELSGGKGAWWRVLKRKLNPTKLLTESGYLTYRFVINCNGETGRFVINGADLNYNKKQFASEAVDHLYNIVSKEINWQHCHGNYRELDSYAYITFKLKDGEIIEILP